MTVLFDLDGTLLDTAPDFMHAINTLRNGKNLPNLEIEEIRPAVSEGLEAMLKTGFNLSPNHAEYHHIAKQCLKLYQACLGHYTKPFAGILELLALLDQHKITWGIVTNRPGFLTKALLDHLQLSDRPACVVSGDTTANAKPHPEPLLYACEKINILPKNCFYIGDAERDIQAGKAAGMHTIGALFGYIENVKTALDWNADHYVHHANEIWPYLETQWETNSAPINVC